MGLKPGGLKSPPGLTPGKALTRRPNFGAKFIKTLVAQIGFKGGSPFPQMVNLEKKRV